MSVENAKLIRVEKIRVESTKQMSVVSAKQTEGARRLIRHEGSHTTATSKRGTG